MHTLLQRLLLKRNVDPKELSDEEKKDFDRWESKLQGKDMTVETIAGFCNAQIVKIEAEWESLDNTDKKNERLILLHTVYGKIARLITSHDREREELEKYLDNLIDSDANTNL
jgi:hypothetical protein